MKTYHGVRGRLWLEGAFRPGWLTWSGTRITEVGRGAPPRGKRAQLEPFGRARILPGFVDNLMHGYAGVDSSLATADELATMTSALLAAGTTTSLVGLYPLSLDHLAEAASAWSDWSHSSRGRRQTRVPGWHVEGPFIAEAMRGALPSAGILRPGAGSARKFLRACQGWVKLATVAPERPRLAAATAVMREQGVVPSIGHTAASYEDCLRLADSGPVAMTHLGNRMPALSARAPGPFGFAFEGRSPWVGIIPDGVHVSTTNLRLFASHPELGPRLMFTSDSIRAAGTNVRRFHAGGQDLRRDGPVARDGDGGLAGTLESLLTMLAKRVREGTLSWEQAIRGGCEVPGRLVGRCGQLRPGWRADLVVLDAEDRPQRVILGGR